MTFLRELRRYVPGALVLGLLLGLAIGWYASQEPPAPPDLLVAPRT